MRESNFELYDARIHGDIIEKRRSGLTVTFFTFSILVVFLWLAIAYNLIFVEESVSWRTYIIPVLLCHLPSLILGIFSYRYIIKFRKRKQRIVQYGRITYARILKCSRVGHALAESLWGDVITYEFIDDKGVVRHNSGTVARNLVKNISTKKLLIAFNANDSAESLVVRIESEQGRNEAK